MGCGRVHCCRLGSSGGFSAGAIAAKHDANAYGSIRLAEGGAAVWQVSEMLQIWVNPRHWIGARRVQSIKLQRNLGPGLNPGRQVFC